MPVPPARLVSLKLTQCHDMRLLAAPCGVSIGDETTLDNGSIATDSALDQGSEMRLAAFCADLRHL